jgi:hypothetical protein
MAEDIVDGEQSGLFADREEYQEAFATSMKLEGSGVMDRLI